MKNHAEDNIFISYHMYSMDSETSLFIQTYSYFVYFKPEYNLLI